MSQEERFNTRDRSYSAWHRRNSTRRYVGIEKAQTLHMIDLDASLYVEYDEATKEPLALIETAMDRGQEWKSATVTKNLAARAGLSAFVLLYKLAEGNNPADPNHKDIQSFRVKMIYPSFMKDWRTLTPDEWAHALVKIREKRCAMIDKEFSCSTCATVAA